MYRWYAVQVKAKALLFVMSMISVSVAQANIQIYPSQGIFGLDQGCRQDPNHIEANGSPIICDFSKAIQNESTRKQAQEIFVQGLQQSFPENMVSHIAQKTKHRTYVASLEVLRASEYVVNKDSTSEIFLPVTLSLKLTNILSGEVLYSDSVTLSQPIKVLSNAVDAPATRAEIEKKFQSTLLTLVQQVTQDMKAKFMVTEI